MKVSDAIVVGIYATAWWVSAGTRGCSWSHHKGHTGDSPSMQAYQK